MDAEHYDGRLGAGLNGGTVPNCQTTNISFSRQLLFLAVVPLLAFLSNRQIFRLFRSELNVKRGSSPMADNTLTEHYPNYLRRPLEGKR